jgi:hypothetical protein
MFFMTASAGYDTEHGDVIGAVLSLVIAITTGAVALSLLEELFES